MADWDRRSPAATAALQATALRAQVLDAVAPSSPFWSRRLDALGRTAASAATPEGLGTLPPAGERDVCPDGDPRGAAALVLQAGESTWALHAEGPRLRQGLVRRLVSRRSYAALVEADTRPLSFVWAGLALRFPVASTRSDLDVVARAGARLWQVLGLGRDDVVVSGLPLLPTASRQALELGALGAGSPLLAPGDGVADVAASLRLVPATVLVLPAQRAAEQVGALAGAGAPLSSVTTLLLLGVPEEAERTAAEEALHDAGAEAVVRAVHVPDGHRLPWGECREGGSATGLHSHPDLELLHVTDPVTGAPAPTGELVLTQLGLRGSALMRWRTGDLVDGLDPATCPGCGRTVPRVLGARPGALVPSLALRAGRRPAPARAVDLRVVADAVLGRPEVTDWRVDLSPGTRDGADRLLLHLRLADGTDPGAAAVAVGEAVEQAAGVLPTQVVVPDDGVLPGEPAAGPLLLGR